MIKSLELQFEYVKQTFGDVISELKQEIAFFKEAQAYSKWTID